MHITEGVITGGSAVGYTGVGFALAWIGSRKMKKLVSLSPEKRPLLGMAGALIFFVSLLPIPAFTGTCSHPCGTPLIAILFGPLIAIALAGGSLLLQAAFFAHGGFGTWGANVIALGLVGSAAGFGTFYAARKLGCPLWLAGFAGGLIGDAMVYAASGFILALELANAPNPQYSLAGYLSAIYMAYLPTQLPIAMGEMAVTGLALQHIFRQRPEVLADLGLIRKDFISLGKNSAKAALILLAVSGGLILWTPAKAIATEGNGQGANLETQDDAAFSGMDEAVNEQMAIDAGLAPRDPYINIEAMGDLWNALLLTAGGICGFIVGRWWSLISRQGATGPAALEPTPES